MSDQIPNSIKETNVLVVGEGPAIAADVIYQNIAHANAIALHNSVSSQNNLNSLYPAIVSMAGVIINNS